MSADANHRDFKPAVEDTPPFEGFDHGITRKEINAANSASMREDVNETPDDFVMPDIPMRPASDYKQGD